MTHPSYHPATRLRASLGTRDLYESIEHDRRRRQLRARMWIAAGAFVAVAGAYISGLGLALALDTIHRLFTH